MESLEPTRSSVAPADPDSHANAISVPATSPRRDPLIWPGYAQCGPRALPERSALERAVGLELFDRLRVDARTQVLPAVVADHEDHVALIDLLCHPDGDRGD